jgi:hypothetical protein
MNCKDNFFIGQLPLILPRSDKASTLKPIAFTIGKANEGTVSINE